MNVTIAQNEQFCDLDIKESFDEGDTLVWDKPCQEFRPTLYEDVSIDAWAKDQFNIKSWKIITDDWRQSQVVYRKYLSVRKNVNIILEDWLDESDSLTMK